MGVIITQQEKGNSLGLENLRKLELKMLKLR